MEEKTRLQCKHNAIGLAGWLLFLSENRQSVNMNTATVVNTYTFFNICVYTRRPINSRMKTAELLSAFRHVGRLHVRFVDNY